VARFEQLARRAALFCGVCAAALSEPITYHLRSEETRVALHIGSARVAHEAKPGG